MPNDLVNVRGAQRYTTEAQRHALALGVKEKRNSVAHSQAHLLRGRGPTAWRADTCFQSAS
jgi:hypothetical protein